MWTWFGRLSKFTMGKRLIRIGFLTCLSCVLWLTFSAATGAIAPTQSTLAQIPQPQILTPGGWQSLPPGVTRIGATEVAPVRLDGLELFRITAPTVQDRNDPGDQVPVEVRARRIEETLRSIVEVEQPFLSDDRPYTTVYDPDSLQVGVAVLDGQTVLVARDARRTQPQVLLTVTQQDAEYYGQPREVLAQQWRDRLQKRLVAALRDRLPAAIQQRLQQIALLLLATSAISLLLWLPRGRLRRWRDRLQATHREMATTQPPAPPPTADPLNEEGRAEFLEFFHQSLSLNQKLSLLEFFRWLLFWAQVLLWVFAIGLAFFLIPQSRFWATRVLLLPFTLLTVWFVTGLLNRLGTLFLNQVAKVWESQDVLSFRDRQRRSLRITTIISALKGLKTFLVYGLSLLWLLSALGVNTSSVLALGAIVAFAVSLAFQNLIRDLVNGFLILLEDQYAIGDIVAIGNATGLVENVNLRLTQLRNVEGRLISIPNSLITQVENLTRSWARVDFNIEVAYDTNARQTLEIIQDVATKFYADLNWKEALIEPPEVLGIENLSHTGIRIRVWLKTQPQEQWRVGREFRLRVKEALDAHKIHIGMPQQLLYADETSNMNGRTTETTPTDQNPARPPGNSRNFP